MSENQNRSPQVTTENTSLTSAEHDALLNWLGRLKDLDFSQQESEDSPLFNAIAQVETQLLTVFKELLYSSVSLRAKPRKV